MLELSVIKRSGQRVAFDMSFIRRAVTAAWCEDDTKGIDYCVSEIEKQLRLDVTDHHTYTVEEIQDVVVRQLMRMGLVKTVSAYVYHRITHAIKRGDDVSNVSPDKERNYLPLIEVITGREGIDVVMMMNEHAKNTLPGMTDDEILESCVLTCTAFIKLGRAYDEMAARMLLKVNEIRMQRAHGLTGSGVDYYNQAWQLGIDNKRYDPKVLAAYDNTDELFAGMDEYVSKERYTYLGISTLIDRYFVRVNGVCIETPKMFLARVAMGILYRTSYHRTFALSAFWAMTDRVLMPSTPTLFNSGTLNSQMSSCYLSTFPDDLEGIYDAIKDDAMLSKFAGGLGNDMTPVRALGSFIEGTGGQSQGVIPFIKVINDTAVAVNQGGKRRGAACVYLETWHLDIADFIELRKVTGDERRRAHDINVANWIPDLFMERAQTKEATWTLFSPTDVPELHDLYGEEFKVAYELREEQARNGEIENFQVVGARKFMRKMLVMLVETGHPWFTFKDPCNIRSPQKHAGVVHSSNLCTEIMENTSVDEVAVCNLASVNLLPHVNAAGEIDHVKLKDTVALAMLMLDAVIDVNMYPIKQAENSNLRHRPVGLGEMGFQDVLHKTRTPYESERAMELASDISEAISYYATVASAELADVLGQYESFVGSDWSGGVLPIDTYEELMQRRPAEFKITDKPKFNWRAHGFERMVKTGMRNSLLRAIAPTATISNICGVSQSIEPTYQNMYVKSNLSGEFTVVNQYLVDDLTELGIWDKQMSDYLAAHDGDISKHPLIPPEMKDLYKTAFQIDSMWLIKAMARRQRWIDQGGSLNLYLASPTGPSVERLYTAAWNHGLKTTYYLRTLAATGARDAEEPTETAPKVCSILDPDCEACQ